MKKRGITVAALAIACVFVVTIIVFSACIYSDYESGVKAASAKFEKLSSRAAEASGIFPSGSREFLNMFNSAVGSPEVFESIRLEIEGQEAYAFPAQAAETRSAFVKSFSTRIVGGDGADIRISANIYAVPPALVFYRAKIAFIVILAGTLTAVALLMYLYLNAAHDGEEDVDFKNTNVDDDFGESLLDEDEAEKEDAPEESPEETSESQESGEEKEGAQEESAEGAGEGQSQENKVDFNPLENAYADQQAELPEAQAGGEENTIAQSQGQGLFSPTSGFGWESYLDTRLESELIRAASSEQDLSLAIIKIPNMTKDSPFYGNICQALLDYFQFKDFVFEYKEDGFAAIVQGKDVDQTLHSAEILHSNLKGVLAETGVDTKPLIGISSRSLRLISAERLKNEAEQALLHAAEDPESPIIAFRVNPEKYRKYISGQSEEDAE